VAVPGLAEGDGPGVETEVAVAAVVEAAAVETASCAVTILVIKRIAPNAIGNFLIEVAVDLVFKVVIGCGVRDLGEAVESGASA
jgi:hypothetical protein